VVTPLASADPERPNALRRGTVHEVGGWRWLPFWPAAWGLDLYYRTLRPRFDPAERAAFEALTGPRIIVAWHNRSLLFPLLVRDLRPERIHTLISASRLAAWEAAYFAHRKIPAIRGSTTRGGAVAAKAALRALRRGEDVAVSPDGPSGPLYDVQPGVLRIARHSGATLVLLGANCPGARRLRTWDRHLVPWPGQAVDVRLRLLPASAVREGDEREACAGLRAALLEINHE
jgi:lysophospholipid acyltransferase (LPLAT)-like uncharacterized protein